MAQVVDYIAFSLLMGASLGVGCYFSIRRKKAASEQTTDELFLGSKSLQTLPLAASVLATVGSATGVVGMPAHMYAYGLHMGWLCLNTAVLIPFAVSTVIPVLYQQNITSVFQHMLCLAEFHAQEVLHDKFVGTTGNGRRNNAPCIC
ncbi:hypothetical protein V5799_011831 [Amblyomma americanum]|uniref:Sodium-dependent multivitamin transporter n=1 Tax=Amblyomma americanum TaxID=6943 RepID=A0AAQ4EFP3_AMBAM